jgi:STE24 endopeptidase
MNPAHRQAHSRPLARPGRVPGAHWPLALAGALIVTRAAVLALRPSEGLIEPDPVDVQEYFSHDDIARARRFGRPQLMLHALGGLVQTGVLVWFVAHPLRLRRRPPAISKPSWALSTVFARRKALPPARPLLESSLAGALLSAIVGLAPLPVSALARRRALAVGLATQSWRDWALDVAKRSAIEMGLAAAAAPAGIALMRRMPRWWWLPGAGVAVTGAAGMTLLAPVLMDPLFNRYTPLPEGDARDDVLELARRAGVEVGEVYEVDASRRTTAANAYVTGLGPTKRVVLFDTLLGQFTRDETRLVVAHELAHVRHRDVPRGLAQLALAAPAGMYAAAQLTRRLVGSAPALPGQRLEGSVLADASSLPALALSLGILSAAIGCISSSLSQRVESRADAFSLRLTDAPEPFVAFERRIVRQNLIDPNPPRWLTRLLASHPPTVERIGIARAYARGLRPGPLLPSDRSPEGPT